jgi:hypothetical protein
MVWDRTPEENLKINSGGIAFQQRLDRLREILSNEQMGEEHAIFLMCGLDKEMTWQNPHDDWLFEWLPGGPGDGDEYLKQDSPSSNEEFIRVVVAKVESMRDTFSAKRAYHPMLSANGTQPAREWLRFAISIGVSPPWFDSAITDAECRKFIDDFDVRTLQQSIADQEAIIRKRQISQHQREIAIKGRAKSPKVQVMNEVRQAIQQALSAYGNTRPPHGSAKALATKLHHKFGGQVSIDSITSEISKAKMHQNAKLLSGS